MSLQKLFIGAVEGKNTWADVGSKIVSLLKSDVVDPLVAFGEQFATDFGKAALAEAGSVAATLLPEILANPTNVGSLIAAQIPVVAATLETQGVTIAATDAIQDANTIIGNALRTQVTAVQITGGNTTKDPAATPDQAATIGAAIADAGVAAGTAAGTATA